MDLVNGFLNFMEEVRLGPTLKTLGFSVKKILGHAKEGLNGFRYWGVTPPSSWDCSSSCL